MYSLSTIKKVNPHRRRRSRGLKQSDAADQMDKGPFDATLIVGIDRGRITIVFAGADKPRLEAVRDLAGDLLDALVQMLPAELQRRCRVCGCTEGDCSQCVEKTGQPCSWVKFDLCSACVPPGKRGAA